MDGDLLKEQKLNITYEVKEKVKVQKKAGKQFKGNNKTNPAKQKVKYWWVEISKKVTLVKVQKQFKDKRFSHWGKIQVYAVQKWYA